jgi:hypothetical protein
MMADGGRGDHRRDRRGHVQVSHTRAPRIVGEVRARDQSQRREDKGQRIHRQGATATWPRDLGEAALTAGRTDTFLGARHRHRSESEVRSPASLAFGRRLHELSSQPLEPSAVATALERQLNSTCHQK